MARFTDEMIERLKQEVDLVRLIESQGYKPKAHGAKDKAICCPFHNDDTASCIITPSQNLFHCFGCGEGGTVIDWVMKTQGVSFRHAVDKLARSEFEHPKDGPKGVGHGQPGVTAQKDTTSLVASLEQSAKPVKRTTTRKLDTLLTRDADTQQLLHQVVDYYHETLKQSPEALEYLQKRGLNHPELIDTFKLGYANRTLGYRLPDKQRQAGKEIRTRLQEIGLMRQSGHEHFTGSLVIPVLSEHNQVTEIYGRKILGNKLRKGTPQHTYLPGPHGGVFNVQSLAASEEVILCESLIDALTFWVNGFRNVTTSYGTNGFTDEHLQAFKDNNIKRVLIAYDRDEAGNKASDTLAEKLMAEGFDCFRIEFPKGMDANEYALQVTPAQKSLGLVIRQATWLGNGVAPDREVNEPEELVENTLTAEVLIENTPPSLAASLPEPAEVSTMPSSPENLSFTEQNNDLLTTLDKLTYRIRGLDKNTNPEQLKLNLLVKNDHGFHVDNLDLYASRARQAYAKQASLELCIDEQTIKQHLGQLLLQLEIKQDQLLKAKQQNSVEGKALTHEERQAALGLLQSPSLLSRILADLDTCGVVGEETNKLVGYLAATSRKLDKPLAVMIQSSSAAGKSSLMDAILQLFPDEHQVKYSAMTGQSLFYMGETNLKHKILAIAEEEGAEHASYALKLLQSEGEVSIASTGKNPTTGNLETQQYKVEGPVMLMMTTTAIDIDEELLNRCLVLTVNESREQTEEIHRKQRQSQTLEGLLQQQDKQDITQLHQNAQRLLRPLLVANPYAEQLTFLSDKTRTRRDHMKYLTLIRSIALLHQYQREVKRVSYSREGHGDKELEYIEVTPQDIATANTLAHEVLGRSLDELPPQTRKLLTLIYEMVQSECTKQDMTQPAYRFSRKTIRDKTGWGNTQIRVHMDRLVDMEYVLVHRGMRGQSYHYELLYQGEGQAGESFLTGLLAPDDNATMQSSRGSQGKLAGAKRPQNGEVSGASRDSQTQIHQGLQLDIEELIESDASIGDLTKPHHNHILAAASSQG